MEVELSQVDEARDKISARAKESITEIFPKKITILMELCTKLDMTNYDFSELRATGDDTDPEVMKHVHEVKGEVVEAIDMFNTLKMWVQMNIPKIEDGNNFGVSVQEESVQLLSRAEDGLFSVLDNITKYFLTRAKLNSKIKKYPSIKDYQVAVSDLDQKALIELWLTAMDVRNYYIHLLDHITKNMDKIVCPRQSHAHALWH